MVLKWPLEGFEYDPEENERALRRYYKRDWTKARLAYNVNPNDFYNAWQFLYYHPIFHNEVMDSYFEHTLDIDVVKVDPVTKRVDQKDESRNTLTWFWLELGPIYREDDAPEGFWKAHDLVLEDGTPQTDYIGVFSAVHDYKLDAHGPTFEEAIIDCARRVKRRYGVTRKKVYK